MALLRELTWVQRSLEEPVAEEVTPRASRIGRFTIRTAGTAGDRPPTPRFVVNQLNGPPGCRPALYRDGTGKLWRGNHVPETGASMSDPSRSSC